MNGALTQLIADGTVDQLKAKWACIDNVISIGCLATIIYLLEGVPLTLSISLISFLIGIAIGIPLSFLRVYEKEISFAVDAYEKVFRGFPEIVLMFLILFWFGTIFSNSYLTTPSS